MASPYWSSPGVSQGRIEPTAAQPDHGFWDFCLGYDGAEPAEFMLNIGEEICLEQTYDFTALQFVNFCWVMRTPLHMPRARTLLASGAVEFLDGSLFDTGDGCMGIVLPTACFQAEDTDQLVTVSGSNNGGNNGTFRVGAVGGTLTAPGTGGHGSHVAPQLDRCVIENAAMVAGHENAITVRLLGARWRARAYVDDVLRAELVEPASHTPMRRNMKLHVSQAAAVTMSFRLTLESVAP